MKKIFGTALVAFATIGLSACGGSENSAAANAADANVAIDNGLDSNALTAIDENAALANETTPADNAVLNTIEPAGNAL